MSMTIEWLATMQHFLPHASSPTLHHFFHSIQLHFPATPEVQAQANRLCDQIARRQAELRTLESASSSSSDYGVTHPMRSSREGMDSKVPTCSFCGGELFGDGERYFECCEDCRYGDYGDLESLLDRTLAPFAKARYFGKSQ